MSIPRTAEDQLLGESRKVLRALGEVDRLTVLEAAACDLSDLELSTFFSTMNVKLPSAIDVEALGAKIASLLRSGPIQPSLAIAALGRPVLSQVEHKTQGIYYTDFRLASFVASQLGVTTNESILDPASGSGILLAAGVIQACNGDRTRSTRMIATKVCAADLDPRALRAVRASLLSLSSSVEAVAQLETRLREVDSLVSGNEAWRDVAPGGFDAIIGNPPWEKVKLSRHEYLQSFGAERHYGQEYDETRLSGFSDARNEVADYASQLLARYAAQGSGEVDLYKVFLELSMALVKDGGRVGLLLPGGLIRSQGTQALREHVLAESRSISLTLLENRSRFFAIDTRFKFLAGIFTKNTSGRRLAVALSHASGTGTGVEPLPAVKIPRSILRRLSPNLAIPEVRSSAEWHLWCSMAERGVRLDDPAGGWCPNIVREVDMTRDRGRFLSIPGSGALPIVEGRMVSQFRLGVKSYRSGSGRRADWEVHQPGDSVIEPQFWILPKDLSRAASRLIQTDRIGFCDVTGQTNERTVLATAIPAGIVCGNKVPTITFDGPGSASRSLTWLALANSFAFDWFARRVVTTTINYFLLLGLPMPRLDPLGIEARRLADLAKKAVACDTAGDRYDAWDHAELRGEMDARVLTAFGATLKDAALIMEDFPLLDRGQPPIPGEPRSTITRDFFLCKFAQILEPSDRSMEARVSAARSVGAVPYMHSEYAMSKTNGRELGRVLAVEASDA